MSLWKVIKKQQNYCSKPYKKERKKLYNKQNPSSVKDNRVVLENS